MHASYDQLIALAAELEGFSGYLTTEDLQARNVVRGQYTQERNAIVFQLLQDAPGEEAQLRVRSDFASLVRESPDWSVILGNIEADLLARIAAQQGRHPWLRAITHYAVPAILALATIAYFGFWFYNDLDVDAPVESRAGIVQRAEAYEKSRTFDELNSGGARHGALRAVLLAPFEPDEAEVAGAIEFLDIVFGGANYLQQEGHSCGTADLTQASTYDERHLELADRVAADLVSPATQWGSSAPVTVLESVARQFPCLPSPATDAAAAD